MGRSIRAEFPLPCAKPLIVGETRWQHGWPGRTVRVRGQRCGYAVSGVGKEQWVGTTINGRFLLLPQETCPGGLSEVRKAVDVTSEGGDYVAVKLLKQRDDAVSQIFLERETSALKGLDHPPERSRIASPV